MSSEPTIEDAGDDEERVTIVDVPLGAAGTRLDAFLASQLPLSRSRIQALVDEGRVVVDGAAGGKSSLKLRGAERIALTEPPPQPAQLVPEDLPLSVLFEDDELLVIDKAAGMAVHPGAGIASGTVANAVLFRCPHVTVGGERRPGIVHRLDKDTSGVLVVCKTDDALRVLAAAFAERRVQKRYLAWCLGVPRQPVAELITGHRRADGDRRRFTTRLPPHEGRRAHSRVIVEGARDGVSALSVEIFTGRTHQIRAHLADIGHPLLQDELYGGGGAEKRLRAGPVRAAVAQLARQALHARSLAFAHPRTGTQLRFVAPLPTDVAAVDRAVRLGVSLDVFARASLPGRGAP